jgi:hypothetical protein
MKEDTAHNILTGQTYTLYDHSGNTNEFYYRLKNLTDSLLKEFGDEQNLLDLIQNVSRKKYFLKRLLENYNDKNNIYHILKLSQECLSIYTEPVVNHLKTLSFRERFNKTISTFREQYYLYMIEIELTNRIFKTKFNSSEVKLAFLPHCLHDLSKDCLAIVEDVDYVCKECSKRCKINALSKLLKSFGIIPYIWREANLKSLFRKLQSNNKSVGVLGVACIVELVNGMRLCQKFQVPVVGIPLNANRCARWMGEFHDTSINMKKVARLIKYDD